MTTTDNLEMPQCWQDFEDALTAGIDRIILFGPAGTGKTYAGLKLGDTQRGAWRLVCTEDMTDANITGHYKPSADGTWKWNSGSAILAWDGDGLAGGRLVIDEIDKASGDVEGLILAMTDSPESASWVHPENGRVMKPRDGFSVVMTTNIEDMAELPMALADRFPVRIRINEPHPTALATLSPDLRGYARRMADAGKRRISLRTFASFDKLRKSVGDERAAKLIFHDGAQSFLDAIRIDKVGA
jgi:MoxR-like ATPase